MNKICVYAISKNEEKFVDKWYESMKEADCIVVLDTGSTDNTVDKLKSHGVIVEQKIITPWRFDVARNESLKLVPEDCNILVCTDLDEVLEPGWADILREQWVNGKYSRAVYKYIWSHLPDGSNGRIFNYDKIHTRDWIWKAPVHEHLYNIKTQSNIYFYESTLNLFDKIILHHYPDQNKSRGSYLPLLKLRFEEDSNDYYGALYLGHEYYYREHYQESIDFLRNCLDKFDNKYTSLEKANCYLIIGDSYSEIAKRSSDEIKESLYSNAIISYIDSILTNNTYIEPYISISKVYMEMKDYSSAIFFLKQGLKLSCRHFSWLERDISWNYEPYDLLCLASYYNGNKKDSIVYAAKALSFDPNNKRLRDNLNICIDNTSTKELIE